MKWFRLAADQGHADAQYNLGLMYYNGHGVPKNYPEAAKWFRVAADQGFAPAQNNLGSLFVMGQGVPRDNVLAHMWWDLSATQGNQEAKENRDLVERDMSPAQIVEAQKLARNWKPKR
jgi:TPR repeat protein